MLSGPTHDQGEKMPHREQLPEVMTMHVQGSLRHPGRVAFAAGPGTGSAIHTSARARRRPHEKALSPRTGRGLRCSSNLLPIRRRRRRTCEGASTSLRQRVVVIEKAPSPVETVGAPVIGVRVPSLGTMSYWETMLPWPSVKDASE